MIFFQNRRVLKNVDALIYCTGYLHSFPFLKGSCNVKTNPIAYPLYKELHHARFPTLSFPGKLLCRFHKFMIVAAILSHINPLIVSEIQAKYSARAFSGKIQLPDEQTRINEINGKLQTYLKDHDSLK